MSDNAPTKLRPKVMVPDEGDGVEITSDRGGSRVQSPQGQQVQIPDIVPIMPIQNTVMFPGTVMPLAVGRERSRRLLSDVLPDQKVIVLVTQKREAEVPATEDLHRYGTAVLVLKLLRMEDGAQNMIVHGLVRVRIESYEQTEPFYKARVTPLPDQHALTTESEAMMVNVRQAAVRIIQLSPNVPEEAQVVLNNIDAPGALADFLASNMPMSTEEKQKLLETLDVMERLRTVDKELHHQLEVLELSSKIQEQVRSNIDRSQREYFLQEQMKAIQKELGQGDERSAEVDELRRKILDARMPDRVRAETDRELDRLSKLPQASPEYTVIRTYLDWMVEIPWSVFTPDNLDIRRAEKILNTDHYDLDKVKKRILEYLAVRKLAPQSRGPILCFAGPPGVGKTSLGQSIAHALGRKFIRMSLGGIRDEAELRGHRRTYIGALPGRIVQEIRKAGSMNPVFMLDELDKVGQDFRGDPTSALLEVLDPAQNNTFQDHYLNVPLDLSAVLFIATANYMGTVPPALRDRMEIMELPGYTAQEKLLIARQYLLPRQLKENGLKPAQLQMTDVAIGYVIQHYTREAGVRELERQIGSICRGVAAKVARGSARNRKIEQRQVSEYLGAIQYESEVAQRTSMPGVATGLAFTPFGGEIIFVEATRFPGRGGLMLTGQIGDVMRESAQAAFSLIRSRARKFGIDPEELAKTDVHIHVPAGAVPKDGPSAGVAMVTALASLLTNKPVHPSVAMTGEITLRGLVLPIGGVKQKALAAKAAGITTVILPRRNRKDLAELPAEVRKEMKFVFASTIEEVLRAAINSKPHAAVRAARNGRSVKAVKGKSAKAKQPDGVVGAKKASPTGAGKKAARPRNGRSVKAVKVVKPVKAPAQPPSAL